MTWRLLAKGGKNLRKYLFLTFVEFCYGCYLKYVLESGDTHRGIYESFEGS